MFLIQHKISENRKKNFRYAEEYVSRNAHADGVGPEFVTNPINAYLLIKRLTSEWRQVLFLEESRLIKNFEG